MTPPRVSASPHRRPVQSDGGVPPSGSPSTGAVRTFVWMLSAVAVGAALASLLTGNADGWSVIALAAGATGTWLYQPHKEG